MITTRMTVDEWNAEGVRRFGESRLKWRFVCPACKHVQAVEDFRPYKDKGATLEDAFFNCVGRFAGANQNAGLAGTGKESGPCNYTGGGLLDLRPVEIVTEGGKVYRSFAFAEPVKEGGAS